MFGWKGYAVFHCQFIGIVFKPREPAFVQGNIMAAYTNGAYYSETYGGITVSGQYQCGVIGDLTELTDFEEFFPTSSSIGIDTAYSTGIAFYFPTKAGVTDSVTFDHQWMPLEPTAARNQIKMKSGSGKLSVYDANYIDKIITIHLDLFSLTKRQRLYKFLMNIALGALKTFQYEDESGTLYTVRWIDDEFNMPMHLWLKHVAAIHLRVE